MGCWMCQSSPVLVRDSISTLVSTSGEQCSPATGCKFCLATAWWESIFPKAGSTSLASITKFIFRTGTWSSSTVFNAASPWCWGPRAPRPVLQDWRSKSNRQQDVPQKSFSVEEKQKNAREEAPCSISKHDTILLPVTVTSSLASHLHLLPETRDLKWYPRLIYNFSVTYCRKDRFISTQFSSF